MKQYVSCLAILDGVHLGVNAGASVTTGTENVCVGPRAGAAVTSGTGNVLLGPGAGRNITTGSYNVVLGGAAAPSTGTAADDGRVVLSDGSGIVRAEWSADGDLTFYGVRRLLEAPAPDADGSVRLVIDATRNRVAFQHRDAGQLYTTVVPTDADIQALVGTVQSAPGSDGASLIKNGTKTQLRRLRGSGALTVDDTNVDAVTLTVPVPTDIAANTTSVMLGNAGRPGPADPRPRKRRAMAPATY